MLYNTKRIKNRILQALYRPKAAQYNFFPAEMLSFIDELDIRIEEKITPLLEDLF